MGSTVENGTDFCGEATLLSLTYGSWLLKEANIIAPKIRLGEVMRKSPLKEETKVVETDRGVFAVETILPNERIMFIPKNACIGAKHLRDKAQKIYIAMQECHKNPSEEPLNKAKQMEMDAILCINDIKSTAKDLTIQGEPIEWREDNGVALFLIAAWKILKDHESLLLNQNDALKRNHQDIATNTDHQDIKASELTEEFRIQLGIDHEDYDVPVAIASLLPIEDALDYSETTPTPQNSFSSDQQQLSYVDKFISFLPYCAVLPNEFNHPLYFSDSELKLLEGTNCHSYALQMKSQIQRDWMDLLTLIQHWYDSSKVGDRWFLSIDDITLDRYLWALSNIYTRCTDFEVSAQNSIHSDDDAALTVEVSSTITTRVMVPLFDMMNHDFSSELLHSIDDDGNISVFNGPHAISEGSEICLNYGRFSNEKLLLVYGFTVHNNPYNYVDIYAPLPEDDPLYALKANFLRQQYGNSPNGPHSILQMTKNEHPRVLPSSLLSTLRLIGIQSYEELLRIISIESDTTDSNDDYEVPIVSRENEEAALTALQSALHSMTRRLALNLISDENLNAASSKEAPQQQLEEELKDDVARNMAKPLNVHNARILCWGEYQILQTALEDVQRRLEKLT